MPQPTDRHRLLPIASASALALAAALGAGAALAVSPAHATAPQAPREPTVRVSGGTADFCLTPGATRALTKAGIRLTAVAPAKLTGPAARRCVSAPVSGGAVGTRFTSGHLAFAGGFDFVRKDRRHLKIDALRGELATSRVTGNVGGSKARRTDFLAFRVDPNRVKTAGGQVRAQLALTLTERGVGAFRGAFHGRSPLTAGQRVFDGEGTARLATQQTGSASPGTGAAQQQSPAPQKQTTGTAPQKQTSDTPQKQTTGAAPQKQSPGAAPQKQQTAHNPRKQTTGTAERPVAGTPQRPATGTAQGQTPAVAPSPATDADPMRENDVAVDPINAIAAD
ncbi:hypothetical protein [Streptomyces sp. NPDC059788]|uniref:hypothetical protein n=1 Tax=Streptomyces sp. NPDC059788 TaxID=3346948 RepID=UPI00365BDF65